MPGSLRRGKNIAPKVLDLRLLGSPEILLGGHPPRFGIFRKTLALLVLLAADPSRSRARGELAEILWPDKSPGRASDNLCQAVASLRSLFSACDPSPFVADRAALLFDPGTVHSVDLMLLGSPPDGCPAFHDPSDCPRCADRMTRALSGIRGPFMEGFSLPDCEEFEVWATAMREETLVCARSALDWLLCLREREGDFDEAIFLLDRTLRMDPLDESRTARLMLLLSRMGNPLAAEQRYEHFRILLKEQVGAVPDPETEAIFREIRSCGFVAALPDLSPAPGGTDPDVSPEWRPATLLFFDLEADEEEVLSESFGPFVDRCAEEAVRLGAVVDRIRKGAFLAWFGVDGRVEGAARRGARTALALRSLLGAMDQKPSGGGETPAFPFRIVLHSGRVVLGRSCSPPDSGSSLARQTLALGDQTGSGSFLVSETAAALLRGQFRLDPAGEFRIPGKTLGGFFLGEFRPGILQWEEGSPPLVGRDRETSLFSDLWKLDQGGVLVVEGEAGIGKSSLVHSFARIARGKGALVRTIECFPQFSDSPFFFANQLLQEVLNLKEDLSPERGYERIVSELRRLGFPEISRAAALFGRLFSLPPSRDFPLPDLSPLVLREEATTLLLDLLRRVGDEEPFLLLAEDLHLIDDSTKELLRRALSDPALFRKVFFLLTIRVGEDPPWLSGLAVDRIRLAPLGEISSRVLVKNLFQSEKPLPGARKIPGPSPDDQTVERIVRTADGVPLFLEELTRSLFDVSQERSALLNLPVPSTLDEILFSRLDRLSEAKPLLQRAAVFGRTVPMDLLRCLSPETGALFAERLERAIGSGLVRKVRGAEGEILVFHHALIADAARRSLTKPDRLFLHRLIATTLRDDFPSWAETAPEIVGRHFEESLDWEPALEWGEKAVRAFLSRGGLREAVILCERLLEGVSRQPPSPDLRNGEIRLHTLLSSMMWVQGYKSGKASRAFQDLLPRVAGDPEATKESFYACYGYWSSLHGRTDLGEFRKAADTLLLMAETGGNPVMMSSARFADGCAAFWEGRFERSIEAFGRSMDCLTPSSGKENLLETVLFEDALIISPNFRYLSLWFAGRYRSALSDKENLFANLSDNPRKLGPLLGFSIMLFRYLRLPDRILPLADQLADLIRDSRMEIWSSIEQGFRGWAMAQLGDPQGLSLLLRSVTLNRGNRRIGEVTYLAMLAEAWLLLGEHRKTQGVIETAIRFSRKSGTHFYDAELFRIKGESLNREGRRDRARKCFLEALRISRSQGARALELRAATSYGTVLEEEGKKEKARGLFENLGDLLDGPESDSGLSDILEARELVDRLMEQNG